MTLLVAAQRDLIYCTRHARSRAQRRMRQEYSCAGAGQNPALFDAFA